MISESFAANFPADLIVEGPFLYPIFKYDFDFSAREQPTSFLQYYYILLAS